MTDPIERVARMLTSLCYDDPDEVIQRYGGKDNVKEVKAWHYKRELAEQIIELFTEQGIPIEQLLSGEMVAMPREASETMLEPFNGLERARLTRTRAARLYTGMINRAVAQLDYAGGQPEEKS